MICAWLLVTTVEDTEKKVEDEVIANTQYNLLIIKTGKKIKLLK